MKKLLLLLGLTAGYFTAEAQNQYLITFKDKGPEAAFFRQHPEKMLSEKSLARRQKHGVLLKEEDLPVSQTYLNQLQQNGIRIRQKSKAGFSFIFLVQIHEQDKNLNRIANKKAFPVSRKGF